jgi:hypothetical protein
VIAVPELARDIELRARDAGCRDGLADTSLIAVALCRVDVLVPELKGETDHLCRLLGVRSGWLAVWRHVQGAETNLWDLRPVVEHHPWHTRHRFNLPRQFCTNVELCRPDLVTTWD